MALSRKALSAMGIEAAQVDQIIEMHSETVNGLKEQITALEADVQKYKPDAEKLPGVQKELDELKSSVDKDKESSATEYQQLKDEYDKYKAEQEQKEARAAKEKAYTELLKDMNVSEKGIAQILKWQGVDGIELDDAGKLKDAKAVRAAVKEDWSDYIQTTETKGAETNTPPAGSGGTTMTKKEIMAVKDAKARQKLISENVELFGQTE